MENRIQNDLTAAIKEQNEVRVATLRSIKAAIEYLKTAPNAPETFTDAEILQIISKLVKQRKDSIKMFNDAGRTDLVDKETAEMNILMEYLPQQMTEEEIRSKINDLKLLGNYNVGMVMKHFKEYFSGQYDSKTVSLIAKEIIDKS